MDLVSFYFRIKRFGKATLKCDILGKEDSYKYPVSIGERFTFSVYFSLASLFLGNLRHESKVFIYTRLHASCEYDNVEVEEK